jgi:glycogen(starch) synthase
VDLPPEMMENRGKDGLGRQFERMKKTESISLSSNELTRVLMTADCVGGVWTYALDLAESLGDFGVEVLLATMGPRPSRGQAAQAAKLSNLQLIESDYKLEWMDSPWTEVDAAGIWLLDLARDFDPQIVHLNGFVHAALDWAVPVVVVAHSCVRSWWQAVKSKPVPAEFDEYSRRVSAALQQASLVVAPTNAMLNAIDLNYSPPVPKKVVPNGRSPSLFFSAQKENFIFTAGRLWDEGKGLPFLEQIAPGLSWPVYAAGACRQPSGGIPPMTHIRALGHLETDTLACFLSVASIYAAPAVYEPFGLTVLEAALSGCALVLSDLPSFRENWSGAALLLPVNDRERWCAALNDLAKNSALRSTLARKAFIRATELRPAEMGARYLSTYHQVLSSSAFATMAQNFV